MEYKVIKAFIDSQTGKGYNEASAFMSNDVERVSFLISKGYLEGEIPKKPTRPNTRKKASD